MTGKNTRKNKKAVYLQLVDLLESKISQNKYRPGLPIPSERELSQLYGISRMTVRKAIDTLETKGLVTRIQGRGTFVNKGVINSNFDGLESMRNFIREEGLLPSNKVIHTALRPAGPKYSRIFNIDDDALIFELFRLRLANDVPIAMEYTRVPQDLIPDIAEHDFEKGSLYELFESRGIPLVEDTQELEVVRVSPPQCNLLRVDEGIPVFMLHNTVTTDSGRVIEHTKSFIHQKNMSFSTKLT